MGTAGGSFLSKFDRAAFWTATLGAFAVYFATLGPSVGCEDSGELATAAAHLGVPHPPGYPFWTFCAWIFCKIFSFVTYMGHPTPAWAVSCLSATFGALAAGCMAALISRSARDMLGAEASRPGSGWLCFGGGVGGALAFAFSPVEWSQSTIVEIYSLNSFFLALIFLLSYKWMCKPSDGTVWLTAFVFGLGLTNYQVLLFAMAPLAIIIFLRNFRLFRDFAMYLIPVAMTWQVLKIGALFRAGPAMASDAIAKHEPLMSAVSCPSGWAVGTGVGVLVVSIAVAAFLRAKDRAADDRTLRYFLFGAGAAVALLALSALGLFAGCEAWAPTGDETVAPLVDPRTYVWVAAFAAASAAAAVAAMLDAPRRKTFLAASAALSIVAIAVALGVDQAGLDGYGGRPFEWAPQIWFFLFLLAALFACALFVPDGLSYAIPVAGFHIAVLVLLKRGAMNGLTHPSSWWFWWPIAWNFVVLALARIALPNGRAVAGAAILAPLGVSFYLYMPVISDWRNPPMNWGYPRTWGGFKHAIMRGQYEAITLPSFPDAAAFFAFIKAQVGHYFSEIKMQFSDFLAFFALVPFSMWSARVRAGGKERRIRGVYAVGALLGVLMLRALASAAGLDGGEAMQTFDRVLIAAMAVVAAAGFAIAVWRQFALPGVVAVAGRRALRRIRAATGKLPVRARFAAPPVSMQWLIASAVCFFMMTIPLILLANVKGDLQDGFIQKVKFISSHAMIALWIGYALTIASAVLLRFAARRNPALCESRLPYVCAALAMIILPGGIPVLQNYIDDDFSAKIGVNEIVHKFGGSEQNGHTFGWQFGAYQLDGCKAIREQITADEEPLPDPAWPEPMEPYSIFFGGTDPGRFVPTYMIYAADFRNDVYLITQNALADETYMSVQRDLYGDEIWIPAREDSAAAFERYVDEVRRGVRQANGDLRIENGRVQVTGALGVMEINSILTQMMFEHDRLRHAFYVEESYPIKWMYPYLSPHGLIMKLNADATPYSPQTAEKDRDFWDWYSKRLLEDPMYVRDFAAQKSFSKLRAALAGLYAAQSRPVDAANAYREAMLLYPPSPEASMRYATDMLLPLGRLGAVAELMDYIDLLDPNNVRTARLRRYVRCRREVERLEDMRRRKVLTRADAMVLAGCYFDLGVAGEAANIAAAELPALRNADDLRAAAVYLSAGGRIQEARAAYARYFQLERRPSVDDVLDSASVLVRAGAITEALRTYDGAYRADARRTIASLSAWLEQSGGDASSFPYWARLVKYCFRAGDRDGAARAFERAYVLDRDRMGVECSTDREMQRIARSLMQQQRR